MIIWHCLWVRFNSHFRHTLFSYFFDFGKWNNQVLHDKCSDRKADRRSASWKTSGKTDLLKSYPQWDLISQQQPLLLCSLTPNQTTIKPLTQTCQGSVIDTYALGPPGTVQYLISWFVIMADFQILISVNNAGTLDQNLWGIGNWQLCSRTTRDHTRPNFVFFHNGRCWNFDFCRQW